MTKKTSVIGTSATHTGIVSSMRRRIGDLFDYRAGRLCDRQTPRNEPRTPLTSC